VRRTQQAIHFSLHGNSTLAISEPNNVGFVQIRNVLKCEQI